MNFQADVKGGGNESSEGGLASGAPEGSGKAEGKADGTGKAESAPPVASSAPRNILTSNAPFNTNFVLGDYKGKVQLFGRVDTGVGYQDKGLPPNDNIGYFIPNSGTSKASSKNGLVRLTSGQQYASELSTAGTLNFTEDVKATFNLTTRFNPLKGQLMNTAKTVAENSPNRKYVGAFGRNNGQWWNEVANIGIDDKKYGSLKYGLTGDSFKDILDTHTSVGGTLAPLSGTPLVNSVKYVTPKIPLLSTDTSVQATGMYQFGNMAGIKHGNSQNYAIGIENKMGDVQVAYGKAVDKLNLGISTSTTAPTANTVNVFSNDEKKILVATKLKLLPELLWQSGWQRAITREPTDKVQTYSNPLFGVNVTNNGLASTDITGAATWWYTGIEYDFVQFPLLKDLSLNTDFSNYRFKGDNATNDANRSTITGQLNYKYNKRISMYGSLTNSNFSGPANRLNNDSQTLVALGTRLNF